jgi:hypothetical protein
MPKKFKFGDLNSATAGLYSGAADFGKDYAVITGAFTFVICVIAFFVGIYLITRKPVYTTKTSFLIKSVTPQTITKYNVNTQLNTLVTTYDLTGTVASCNNEVFTLPGYPTNVAVGTSITVFIKDCTSREAHYQSDDTKMVGWGVVGISIGVILFTLFKIFLVKKYKGLAALQGAAGAKRIFSAL